jgi:phage shock protein A
MSWLTVTELESKLNTARENETKMFHRYLQAYETKHQAWKENQSAEVIAFAKRMEEAASDAYDEAKKARDAAWEAFQAACQQHEPPPPPPARAESAAATPPNGRTKTAQLQAALDEAAKTCLPLQGAKVTYKQGEGFYVRHGDRAYAFLQNFKRGMLWIKECRETGRPNFSELRLR